jgi:hypothetical protein
MKYVNFISLLFVLDTSLRIRNVFFLDPAESFGSDRIRNHNTARDYNGKRRKKRTANLLPRGREQERQEQKTDCRE